MADPRNAISFEGLDNEVATFLIDNSTIVYDATKLNGSAQVGLAVTLSADGTVALCADGDAVIGKLQSVESDNKAAVSSTTRGLKISGALGAASAKGYIREVASATAAEINKGTGQIIDASVSTAVWVRLF